MPWRFFDLFRKKIPALAVAVVVLTAVFLASRSFWQAQRVLNRESARVTSSSIPFTLTAFAGVPGSPFERIFPAADFHSFALFGGDFFVSGPSSLLRYDARGVLKQSWYVGADLPPKPLGALAVRQGVGTPELWIATDGAGILIYDGSRFRQLRPRNTDLRRISALLPLTGGRIIFGTPEAGVYETDGTDLELLHSQFANAHVTALAGDSDEIWIGTRDHGAWLWHSGRAIHFERELPDLQVLSIYKRQTKTWIGTPVGVAEFDRQQFRRPLAEGVFAQSLLATDEALFVGTLDQGVADVPLQAHFLRAARHRAGTLATLPGSNIASLISNGQQVLALSPGTIVDAQSGERLIASPAGGVSDGHITALLSEARGRLWVGYFDRGVDVFETQPDKLPVHFESDTVFCVDRIKEDPDRATIAVATANGLALFDPSPRFVRSLDTSNGLISNHVSDVLFQQPGQGHGAAGMTIATSSGVTFVTGGAVASLSVFHGLVSNHVNTLAVRGDDLIAGTLGGISRLHRGDLAANYTTANSDLQQNWITASAEENGTFYLGTYGSGVIRLNRDWSITGYTEFARQRVEINPHALLLTACCLYAGTANQGLAVLRRGDTRWRFISAGLPSTNVTALAAHGETLYVGTDNGLVSVSESRLGL